MPRSLELSLLSFLLLLSPCVGSSALAQPASVLGLEPGERKLCNDDIGIILWGPDSAPTLSIGKSDVWDRRNPAPPEPIMTLARMKELAFAGDESILNGRAYYSSYNAHDFPCPKPVGQIILKLPFLGTDGKVTSEEATGCLKLRATQGSKGIDLRIFVSSQRNLIVLAGSAHGLEPGDLEVRLYRHRDTIVPGGELHPTLNIKNSPHDFEQLPMPQAGTDGGVLWVAQDFDPEPTFPKGFSTYLVGKIGGVDSALQTFEGEKNLGTAMIAEEEGRLSHAITKRFTPINEAPGSAATARIGAASGPIAFYFTVATTQDDPDPLGLARKDLEEAMERGVEALWKEHLAALEDYETRRRSFAQTADGTVLVNARWGGVPYKVRPPGYYGDVPLCSVDTTKYCFQDSSRWHADFHFNELGATSLCITHQFDTLDSYFRMILNLLPMAQTNAREVYGCAGAMYPLVHYPLKADTVVYSNLTWEQSMEITALILKPFWQRFQYSWDLDFLRELAYPAMREGARFYADYLKPGEDGLYHVFPTVSPEHRGITKNLEFNQNSQSGITLIRYHLRAAAQAARILGVDPEEAKRWAEIAEHMPPYPTVETERGPIFIDVAGAQPIEYNIPVPLSSIFWGDDIGLDSSPEELEIALRTLDSINVWEPHRGYLNGVRTRLGIVNPEVPLGVENLVQSHTKRIHVFPAVPEDFSGSFENLGAQGAFVLSATMTEGTVDEIRIESLAGNECVLANPWPGKSVQVTPLGKADRPQVLGGESVRFPTVRDGIYRLSPISGH